MILRIIPRFLVVNSIAILRMVLKMILKLGIAIELHPCNPGDGLLILRLQKAMITHLSLTVFKC